MIFDAERIEFGRRFAALLERAETRSDPVLREALRLALRPFAQAQPTLREVKDGLGAAAELLEREHGGREA
jgi:hypothetical protein